MFNFFKRKAGKASPEWPRRRTSLTSVDENTRDGHDVTSRTGTLRKDVVNLLIPETDYSQRSGVGALLQIMAGKRKRNKRKRDSFKTDIASCGQGGRASDATPTPAKNTQDVTEQSDDHAEYVKALVLQKYSKPDPKQQHVSLVYVSNDELDDKKHAEALLREIAKSIDCTIDEINNKQMGSSDSRQLGQNEQVYQLDNNSIDTYKNDLNCELEKLLQTPKEDKLELDAPESPATRKSNLKPPRSDTEACSDDDRSDSGKKRVTFRKHIIFDDGEQQTDEGDDSSFESLTSEEADYLDEIPDNDELLGGYVVTGNDNATVINVKDDDLRRISGDNSDSGFLECDKESGDETNVRSICDETDETDESDESHDEIIDEESDGEAVGDEDNAKSLVNQETQFQSQVTALTELADKRCTEAEHARELIVTYRKEIEEKEKEIHQLKCDIASAYKECELVRQRSRSIEEDLVAARRCTAELADEMQQKIEEAVRQLRLDLDEAHARRLQLEERVKELEEEKQRLEQEKLLQEQNAKEALEAAEANTAKWRSAHEAARSQAAARAERILADCEWKMRELEKRARDVEKEKKELTETVEKLKSSPPTPSHMAELQQLRGLASEQQRSVQSLALQLQKVETREEELKLEVHRLKDLLEKEARSQKEKEEMHLQAIARLEEQHTEKVNSLKNEHAEALASAASARAALERAHAERTRAALTQLREEAERDVRNGERKLRELNTRFENLKEVLASKEAQFERAIAEAHSKADWDILQLRHLLDKADITYANNVEAMNERFEREKAQLIEEWSEKLREVEQRAATSEEEAKNLLQATRQTLVAEKMEQMNKLKEKHRLEMDEQWEHFMADKEMCLERMKMECRQEGEEEREKRERELVEEVAELKSRLQSQMSDYEELSLKAAACGRTLAVTEQELREALDRERELRDKRREDAERMGKEEKKNREQIEHLTRKCACLRKLFDDMRTRLAARERVSEQEARAKDKEIQQLKTEVARLTKLLMEQSGPTLGARTRADGCESFLCSGGRSRCEETQDAPRRKGGTLKTPEMTRKRTLPELQPLPPEARRNSLDVQNGRRRAKSVDLPAVQVPVRIKQLEEKTQQ
ncbi:unnamed protein product [Danaus chrysippus]|uniref:(African queen) hypothetical protein n=1 Tax=Danaus chrysippus TaxID=151541 RepID=A0A8J2W8J2_9NEOP|nr:unnamed protein product [Danaus chrysippus]